MGLGVGVGVGVNVGVDVGVSVGDGVNVEVAVGLSVDTGNEVAVGSCVVFNSATGDEPARQPASTGKPASSSRTKDMEMGVLARRRFRMMLHIDG